MSLPQIVVTRPIEQAREFVKLAPALAGRTEIFSLLEIHPLENRSCITEMVARLNEFALVVFVSPNAINAFLRSVHHWPMAIPIAIMGEGSRKALVANGIFETNAKIFSPRNLLKTDSETLLLELDLTQLSGKKVLIIRGETGRELLADALRSHDIEVVTLPVYRRSAPVFDTFRQQKLRILLQQRNLWIITSSEALRILYDWIRMVYSNEFVAKLQCLHLFVPHARIEETAKTLGFPFVTLTASGDENLLVALQSYV